MTQPRLEVLPSWYQVMDSIEGARFPSLAHCDQYLSDKNISEGKAEDVALSMKASLRYHRRVDSDGVIIDEWIYTGNGGKRAYVDLWAVFQQWRRSQSRRPGTNGSQGGGHYRAHGLATTGKYARR